MKRNIERVKPRNMLISGAMADGSAATALAYNAVDLARRMNVDLALIASAVHANITDLNNQPRAPKFQQQLAQLSELWNDIVALAGDENRGHQFLKQERPELEGKSPLYYFSQGEPRVVELLVTAMLEMLP